MSPPPAATLNTDSLLRATARLQEAPEPARQKPIIKFEPQHQNHLNQANQLAGSVRASIDSGRDNPFRPDGEIYKLTNPIVDYYKFGPNQSRSATPTYAELDYFSSKNKRKRKAAARKAQKERRQPCWRRWFCCCCCCCGRCRDAGDSNSPSEPTSERPADGAGQEPGEQVGDHDGGGEQKESDLTSATNNNQATSLGGHKGNKAKRVAKKQVQLGDEMPSKEINTTTTSQTNGAHSNSSTAVKMVEERTSCDPTLQEEPKLPLAATATSTTKIKTIGTTNKRCLLS